MLGHASDILARSFGKNLEIFVVEFDRVDLRKNPGQLLSSVEWITRRQVGLTLHKRNDDRLLVEHPVCALPDRCWSGDSCPLQQFEGANLAGSSVLAAFRIPRSVAT